MSAFILFEISKIIQHTEKKNQLAYKLPALYN